MTTTYTANIDSSGLDGFVSTTETVAINYSQEIAAAATTIATALNAITAQLTTLNTTMSAIATDIETIKSETVTTDATLATISSTLSAIATDIDTIRALGDTTGMGFYTRGEGGISNALMWKALVAEGLMNDVSEVSASEQAAAIQKINDYLQDYNDAFNS